ncbi:MAG: sugar ABC transporter ATP-binding protein [Planctomycetota bacterium]
MIDRSEHLLEIADVTKRYAATVLDRCRLDVRDGEIHALVGANGAGKSTLCKIVAGLTPANSGAMTFCGKPYAPSNKQAAERAGVQIVQQELNLVPTLSVAENLLLTRLPTTAGVIRRRRLRESAQRALDRLELSEIRPDSMVGELGVGRQQMIEIAAALDRDCRLLILDEPTAALTSAEAERLFAWLRRLRTRGVGMVYVSHRLEEVAGLADRITVLRDGRDVATQAAGDLSIDEMVRLMSGEGDEKPVERDRDIRVKSTVALRVDGLTRGFVRDVSFAVHHGERLGVAGLVGSGRTELLRAIFGADVAESGRVFVGDCPRPRRFRQPSQAVAAGLAMVTEDRKQNGLLLSQSLRVNATLSSLSKRFAAAGVIRPRAEQRAAESQCQTLETQCRSVEQSVATLSGGNQQKVAIAKWLLRDATTLLFDEPTRGIDVAARRTIYRLLGTLAAEGKAIVMASSDVDELLDNCDRIAVMSDGCLVETFVRPEWSHEGLMQAAFSRYFRQAQRSKDSPESTTP